MLECGGERSKSAMIERNGGRKIFPVDQSRGPEKILIRNGRVIDPVSARDKTCTIACADGVLTHIGDNAPVDFAPDRVIDATGLWIIPGMVDMHVHLREPGREDNETIETGTRAASAGGFTSVLCMPNTNPVLDEESKIRYVFHRAELCTCRVFPVGSITKGRKGEELSPFGEMVKAGAKAFSDDGTSVKNAAMMRNALNYSKSFGIPLLSHCEDTDLSQNGVMNESEVSTSLGLRGIPSVSEEVMVARDLMLAEYTGARIHICHVSTARSVALIREAKKNNRSNISCETCPHYFVLNDTTLADYDSHKKMNPPLRTEQDRLAILEGLADGTIDTVASDHAPHVPEEKRDVEFNAAAFGVVGLETLLGAVMTHCVGPGLMSIKRFVEAMSLAPRSIVNIGDVMLQAGYPADLTIIDPKRAWSVDAHAFFSKGRNTPFDGIRFTGAAAMTIMGGRIVFSWNCEERGPGL